MGLTIFITLFSLIVGNNSNNIVSPYEPKVMAHIEGYDNRHYYGEVKSLLKRKKHKKSGLLVND